MAGFGFHLTLRAPVHIMHGFWTRWMNIEIWADEGREYHTGRRNAAWPDLLTTCWESPCLSNPWCSWVTVFLGHFLAICLFACFQKQVGGLGNLTTAPEALLGSPVMWPGARIRTRTRSRPPNYAMQCQMLQKASLQHNVWNYAMQYWTKVYHTSLNTPHQKETLIVPYSTKCGCATSRRRNRPLFHQILYHTISYIWYTIYYTILYHQLNLQDWFAEAGHYTWYSIPYYNHQYHTIPI